MVNKYCVKENEIWIEAPGSARMNKIKNDLISSYIGGPNPVVLDRSKPYIEFFPQ